MADCPGFAPQAFRKKMCANCFLPEDQHGLPLFTLVLSPPQHSHRLQSHAGYDRADSM